MQFDAGYANVPAIDTSIPASLGGKPLELDPVVQETEEQHKQHVQNVDAAAYHGAEATFKLDPRYKLGTWGEREETQRLAGLYAGAPVLASIAARSPDDSQRYALIADYAAAVEHVVMGTDAAPNPAEAAYYRANGLPVPERSQMGLASTIISKSLVGAYAKVQRTFADLQELFARHPGPKSPAELAATEGPRQTAKDLKDILEYETPGVNERSGGAQFARGIADFLPTAAALSAAPWAAFPVLALDSYGGLRMRGVDPGWAMAGGIVSGAVAMVPGQKFISGLATKAMGRTEAQVLGAQIASAYGSPTVLNALKEFGKESIEHTASGYLMQVGMGLAQEGAAVMDEHGKTGKVPDVSALWQRTEQILKDSLAPAVFFGAIGGANKAYYASRGREIAAHSDNVVLNSISDLVEGSKDPEAMRDHLRMVVDKRRSLRSLETATQIAEQQGSETAMAWGRAANDARAELRAYVTAPEFAAAAKRMGMEPEMLARRVLLNGSIGFKDAEIMKIPLAMPLEDFVHQLKGDPDGASLHADVPAVSALKDEPKVETKPTYEAALRDPTTGKVESGVTHTEALGKFPSDAQERNFDEGFLVDGKFQTREEVLATLRKDPNWKVLGGPGAPSVFRLTKEPGSFRGEEATRRAFRGEVGTHAEAPTAAPAPVRSALEQEARQTLEKMPVSELKSDQFKRAVKQALSDFEKGTPEEKQAAANAWERAKAHEAARVEADKEATKTFRELGKLDSDKARKAVHAAGTGTYGKAWDALHGLKEGQGDARGLVAALDALRAQGETYDEDTVRGAVAALARGEAGTASLSELRDVRDLLNTISYNAEHASKTLVEGQLQDRTKVIESDMLPSMRAGMGGKKPPDQMPGGLRKFYEEQLRILGQDPEKMTHHALLQPFGAWGRDRSHWYIKARRAEDVLIGEMGDVLGMSREHMALGQQPTEWPAGIKIDTSNMPALTRRDAWRVLLNMGNVEDATRLSERWGLSEAQIESWLRDDVKLTKPEYDKVQDVWHGLAKLEGLVAGARSNRNAAPLKGKTPRTITTEHGEYTGGSAPWEYMEDMQRGPENPHEASARFPEGGIRKTFSVPKPDGLIMELLKGKTPSPYWDTLGATVKEIVHDVSFSDFKRDTFAMLNDPRFVKTVNDNLGKDWYDRLTGWYNVASEGHIQRDANASRATKLLFGVRHLAAQAAFNLNVPVIGGQIAHLPTMMARFGIGPLEMRTGIARAMDPAWAAFADEHSDVVPYRTERYREKYLDLMAEVSGDKRRGIFDLGAAPGMALQHGMDRFLTRALWNSFYAREINNGRSHAEAVKEADLRTDQSMPGISVMDQSALMRDRVYGAFFLIRNFPQTVWNLKAMDSWDTRARVSGGASFFDGGHGGLIARRLGMYAGLGLGMYLMGHGRNESEQKAGGVGVARWVGRELLLESTYGNPILHELMRFGSSFFDDGGFNARNAHLFETPVGQLTGAILRDLGKLRHGDGGEKAFAALDAAGRALGILAPAALRSARGAYQLARPAMERWRYGDHRLLTAEDFPGFGTTASMLYYGPRPEATPLTDAFGGRSK